METRIRDDYAIWKDILRRPPYPGDVDTMEQFWKYALRVFDQSDSDSTQRLVRDLVDPKSFYGLKHIQQLLEEQPSKFKSARYILIASKFVQVITHPALLDSLSIDIYVGDLYNLISGSGGTRAVPFFKTLVNRTSVIDTQGAGKYIDALRDLVVGILTALREVLRRVPRANYHEDIPQLFEALRNSTTLLGFENGSGPTHDVRRLLAEVQRIAERAGAMLGEDVEQKEQSEGPIVSTYPQEFPLPGGRHDNDKTDITQIKILPTMDEIQSEHPEFLPSTSTEQPHFLKEVERYLDTHFRLLRHDVFGELKSALGGFLASSADHHGYGNIESWLGNLRAYAYRDASIRYLAFTRKTGLEVQISFPQPKHINRKSGTERRKWWEDTRRLSEGSLMCLLPFDKSGDSLLFLTVSHKEVDPSEKYGLSFDARYATISGKLARASDPREVELLLTMARRKNASTLLIEFPTILLATFMPILQNMQQMFKVGSLPFKNWLLPDSDYTYPMMDRAIVVPQPLYARKENFTYDLSPILQDSTEHFVLDPKSWDNTTVGKLERSTSLDHGQCNALIAALTRELALIQGPPGTGKSYLGVKIMRVLLHNKGKAKLGPILIVCFTNHALDQFLEHLVAAGIEKIIRIGSQSKSRILEGKNIRVVAQGKTRTETHLVGQAYATVEEQEKSINRGLRTINSSEQSSWKALRSYVALRFNRIYVQFLRQDSEGFMRAGKSEPFDLWSIGKGEILDKLDAPLGEINAIITSANRSAYKLALSDRKTLLVHWVQELTKKAAVETIEEIQEADSLIQRITNVHDEVDRRALETADVIGVTTSGLARRVAVLRNINTKVVLCEEAGEVLEGHIISTLIPSVQHLIQIGDHQQLRPQINNFNDLSVESRQGYLYKLDRSQFERLSEDEPSKPPFPIARLDIQRRMRPEISCLVRNTLYPGLVDHDSVKQLPSVCGMKKNTFWLNHTNLEDSSDPRYDQKSRSNTWEVQMTHALVRHIVRQGVYTSQNIAVLTPYVGQLQKLRKAMGQDFEVVLSDRDQEKLINEGIIDDEASTKLDNHGTSGPSLRKKAMTELLRIATVDNFQGEEAQVVIISLVRSNEQRKVGFLRTTNRINVLLSRAQHGMYIIGNADTYSNIPMWTDVIGMLRTTDSVGEAFQLCCPRHMDTELTVSKPEDFERFSPEGGCNLQCDRQVTHYSHYLVQNIDLFPDDWMPVATIAS